LGWSFAGLAGKIRPSMSDDSSEHTPPPRLTVLPGGRNDPDITRVAPMREAPRGFEEVFTDCFADLARLHRSLPREGALVAAARRDKVEGYLHVPSTATPQFATLGRHGQCDLVLSGDGQVSLRHLTLALLPRSRDLRTRVWDLATSAGFHTESDVRCEGLLAEGPLFVRVASYHIFLFPTGSATLPWGDSAQETWGSFPERVYLDQRIPTRGGGAPQPAPAGHAAHSITHLLPPVRLLRARRRRLWDEGLPLGQVRMKAADEESVFPVLDTDADHGLLVGRYDRCALGVTAAPVSRVHLLLTRIDGEVWAVDTASTNGTFHNDCEIRQIQLKPGLSLRLGNAATVTWEATPP
jgi:hypothetical protein